MSTHRSPPSGQQSQPRTPDPHSLAPSPLRISSEHVQHSGSTSNVTRSHSPSSQARTLGSPNFTPPTTHATSDHGPVSPSTTVALCSRCNQPMSGRFVRALGTVFHLDCFRCSDCGIVVASKFFPVESVDKTQQPLCEQDYFRRLGLICSKCHESLRGSYITACNKKFHVEHFTCSVCPTLFKPQDPYYEHDGDVYCHFHYSTRFATKCVGCSRAILKQFVEIARNMKDECWHPECYMIHKFWNIKVAPESHTSVNLEEGLPNYTVEERSYDAISLRHRQTTMETLVYRIWTLLSTFEESSAACVSDMLRLVSNGTYMDAIRMAEKLILHIEAIFAAIDELDDASSKAQAKRIAHVREAHLLCRAIVDLFTLLSHTQDSGSDSSSSSNPTPSSTAVATITPNQQSQGVTQELLAVVTRLAHYLKILIRIALTGALKLENELNNSGALFEFLNRLQALASAGADPSHDRIPAFNAKSTNDLFDGVAYGYRSLAPKCAGKSPFGEGATLAPPSDVCLSCKLTVEKDCVRLGTYQRWHSQCMKCSVCGKAAATALTPSSTAGPKDENVGLYREANAMREESQKISSERRPPANVDAFRYDGVPPSGAGNANASGKIHDRNFQIYCIDHASDTCQRGFCAVSRSSGSPAERSPELPRRRTCDAAYYIIKRTAQQASPVAQITGPSTIAKTPSPEIPEPSGRSLAQSGLPLAEDIRATKYTKSSTFPVRIEGISDVAALPDSEYSGARPFASSQAPLMKRLFRLLKRPIPAPAPTSTLQNYLLPPTTESSPLEDGLPEIPLGAYEPEDPANDALAEGGQPRLATVPLPKVVPGIISGAPTPNKTETNDARTLGDHLLETSAASEGPLETKISLELISERHGFLWTKFIRSHQYGGGEGHYRQTRTHPDARGGFSEVWKCEVRNSDEISGFVAVKRLRATMITTRNTHDTEVTGKLLKRLQRELTIWMALESHPNIVPLLGFALANELSLVSPWCPNGNIRLYLKDHADCDRLKLILDVAKGLAYLHGRTPSIVHGDIKPDNILISSDGSAMLTDFGLSKVVEDEAAFAETDMTSLREAGNIRWMAPELWKSGSSRLCESDVYSFGCVALEVFTGQPPFAGVNEVQLYYVIFNGGKPASRDACSEFEDSHARLWRVMCSCWETVPEDRSNMAKVTQDIEEVQDYVAAIRWMKRAQ